MHDGPAGLETAGYGTIMARKDNSVDHRINYYSNPRKSAIANWELRIEIGFLVSLWSLGFFKDFVTDFLAKFSNVAD